jgi:hypothetical protein
VKNQIRCKKNIPPRFGAPSNDAGRYSVHGTGHVKWKTLYASQSFQPDRIQVTVTIQ